MLKLQKFGEQRGNGAEVISAPKDVPIFVICSALTSSSGGMETWNVDVLGSTPRPVTVVHDAAFKIPGKRANRVTFVLSGASAGSPLVSAVVTVRTAARLARKTRQLLVSHQPLVGLLLIMFGLGRRLIQVVHNDFERQVGLSRSSAKRWALFLFERIVIKHSLGVVCSCGHYFKKLCSLNKNVFRIGAFVNPRIFRPRGRIRSGILWVGRMERVKNPELALDAYLAGLDKHGEKIAFVGSGPLKQVLVQKLEESGVHDLVSFYEGLSPRQLSNLMASSKVLLSTSRSEGHPRALLEAIASGMNIVALPASDPEDLVRSMGVGVVVSENLSEISEGICEQLQAPEPKIPDLRSRFRETAAEEFFEWIDSVSRASE